VICGGPYGYIAGILAAVQKLGKSPDTLPNRRTRFRRR